MPHPSKKVSLVTGANKGIGLEIARELGKAGQTVFLGARNPGLGRDATEKLRAENLDVHYVELDLARPETINATAATIKAHGQKLDVLVNNAGIVDPSDGPPSSASLDAVRRTFETNFLGPLAVTQIMLPLLREAPDARIVNVSSGLGSLTLNGDPDWEFAGAKYLGYNGSKAALNMLTVQLAFELRDTGIKVNSADPGFTATDLNGNQGYQSIAEGAAEAVRLALLPPDGPTGGFFETAGPRPW
ncbi:MAG: SDR family oxidoreductase [Bryobacteraceae bacterium]|nr:SDR family oxidoreductase [Bryobacteraceae bacterium]